MKSLQQAIQQRDAGALQSMMPEEREADSPGSYDAVDLFNELFRQIRATMPAAIATIKSQADLDELRRQWTMAFKENGIRQISQIEAGMVVARQQEKPFLPSPGQFVAWCKQGCMRAAGLPGEDELVVMVKTYSARRGGYVSAEAYPWPNNAAYWMVTRLYTGMRFGNWSEAELLREARKELMFMARRIEAGETIPTPVKQITSHATKRPLSRQDGLTRIQEIRRKFGFKTGDDNG
ncbi:replication protein P [Sodalis sp. RH22]|uniref:replication protein P n=1 Tax=unclassified Sodalis (in: enterobacteria) TaxID=2636512 RepID=UPI0039B63099